MRVLRSLLALAAVSLAASAWMASSSRAGEATAADAKPDAEKLPIDNKPVGGKVENFTLKDFRGQPHALADFQDKKAVVVVFLGAECPLAKLYGPRLQQLATEFAPQGIAFLGIDSNRQDSITELDAYAHIHGVSFPILKDVGNAVADRFGTTRTPEVFVLDRKGPFRYHGRIDGQYSFGAGVGYAAARSSIAATWPKR